MAFKILISVFSSYNKFRSFFLFWIIFFKKRGFLFILELLAGFLGFLDGIDRNLLGSSEDSPFKAFSGNSEASSISAEKLNLLGPTDMGKNVRLKKPLGRVSSLSKLCLKEPCLKDLLSFSTLRQYAFLLRIECVSVLVNCSYQEVHDKTLYYLIDFS